MKLYLKFICFIIPLIALLPNNVEAVDLDLVCRLAYDAFMFLISSAFLVFWADQCINHPENFRHVAYFE
jgi:hypothetical protein